MKTPEQLAEEYADKHECGDQAWGGAYGGFLAGYRAAAPQWISVKDRLPERGDFVLVNTEFGRITVAKKGWESWVFNDFYKTSYERISYVTHWMPLPKPPTE